MRSLKAWRLGVPEGTKMVAFNPRNPAWQPEKVVRHLKGPKIPAKNLNFLYLLVRWLRPPLKKRCNIIIKGCEIVLGIFFWAGLGFFFGFLGWYHLPSVCHGLELEFVILHGICHILACSPSILHGSYYMWACSPSILYAICHILACSPSILHGISYMWACSPSILYGICHILACSPSILHGMFYMWACSPKYLQMRKLGIR